MELTEAVRLAQEGDATLEQRLEIFQRRKAAVERQIAELQETLSLLEYKCWYYETACQAGTEDVVRTLLCSQVPDECRAALEKLDPNLE